MLAYYTPAPQYPIIRNELIDQFQKNHQYEIVTWPMHYPDELCMDYLRRNTNPNVILYIALMKGITPIVTIGDHKSFIVDFTEQPKSRLPRYKTNIKSQLENDIKKKRHCL